MSQSSEEFKNNFYSMVSRIKDKFHPEKIILFGSRAKDLMAEGSDIDLLVVMKTDKRTHKQASLIRLFLEESGGVPCPMDILVRSPLQIEQRLKEGDFFIQSILSQGISL